MSTLDPKSLILQPNAGFADDSLPRLDLEEEADERLRVTVVTSTTQASCALDGQTALAIARAILARYVPVEV